MISELVYRRRVQFYETDLAGIVHFSWFFRYMEEAEHEMWRAAGLSIESAGSDVAWPRIAASCEFLSPLRFEDEFEVVIRITSMTSRTIEYTCLLRQGDTEVARGTLKVACVRRVDGRLAGVREIPEDVRRRFAVFGR